MACKTYSENGLSIQYVPTFFEKELADNYLSQLRVLPFYKPTLILRGKAIKPNRLVLGYGESGMCYNFSGTSIPAEPWTPLMLKLRDEVEKFTACTFNFVLLNFYPDGTSSIAQHRDNEVGIDSTFPIAVLSFGAERTIEFKKADTPSTLIQLEHGSLYCMQGETNKLFTHGIAAEPDVKAPRISLTFRHLIPTPKRPRLEPDMTSKDCAVPPKDCALPQKDCAVPPKDCASPQKDCAVPPKDCASPPKDYDLVLPNNDWLSQTFKKAEAITPVLNDWNLNWNTLVQIVMDPDYHLRVHIRAFKECKSGRLIPTKTGVVLTQLTWLDFQSKISKIKFRSCSESFVANNQLLVACIDEETILLQQIFPLNGSGFHLKPTTLKLSKEQVKNLCDLTSKINNFLIEAMLTIQLPKLIISKPYICNSHLNYENCKENFFKCIYHEIVSCVYDATECDACDSWPSNQNLHICDRPVFENYSTNTQNVLLRMNILNILENIRKNCSCFLDPLFFGELTYKMCVEKIDELLFQHKEE